jgi:hypothetical protein
MSVSYLSDKEKSPVIVELDFDLNAQEVAKYNQMYLEFPLPSIKNVNNLHSSLQREKILNLDVSKTKTDFAYGLNDLS